MTGRGSIAGGVMRFIFRRFRARLISLLGVARRDKPSLPKVSSTKIKDAAPRSFVFLLVGGALVLGSPAHADINVRPDALMHYSYCISHAKDRASVFLLDRGTLYRCGDDIAVAYFNYLGRQRMPERRVVEAEGVFIYRMISGIGKCWNKIEDAEGNPVSIYGCDVYVEL
ncbi:hypothetical protein [Methylocystis sp. SC2]|uniref:hypothetical protein n=1 Tax=Methylocystis sp. (strain SC2) TaxID=187303 RepID=UPI001FCB3A04|nr:hypothetical protein [Methylocystis sp. SC2]